MSKFAKITIAAGHNRVPNKGAIGILDEDKCTKETAMELNTILLKRGVQVYDVTPYGRIFANAGEALAAESEAVNRIRPDLHICIHYNASGSDANGTEVLVYGPKSEAYPIARKVLDKIVQRIGTKSRGVKSRPELHILNKTTCPTILTEALFIDNKEDVKKYNAFMIATAIADAILEEDIKMKYTKIEGFIVASENDLVSLLMSRNPQPKIKCSAQQLVRYFLSEGATEGIRGDIAFCQSLHETGNFNYGGLVLPEQNNYCGLGATNNSAVGKGAWFETPQQGVKAQIQHLKAYANDKSIFGLIVDPRFNLVTRGSAPTWEELAGKWAWPGYSTYKYKSLSEALEAGDSYGQTILRIYDKMKPGSDPVITDDISAWAMESWAWAKGKIISETSKPKDTVTKEEVVQMIYNWSKL